MAIPTTHAVAAITGGIGVRKRAGSPGVRTKFFQSIISYMQSYWQRIARSGNPHPSAAIAR